LLHTGATEVFAVRGSHGPRLSEGLVITVGAGKGWL
jgi:hypothetical protein